MKTHHFILKEDGNIYVIPEMPEKPKKWNYQAGGTGYMDDAYVGPEYYDHIADYEQALDHAKESALLVENQKDVLKAILKSMRIGVPITDGYLSQQVERFLKSGQIYPLECGIEVKSLRGDATIGYYTKCGRYWCDECCNGDRCDDSTHRNRKDCPYCNGSGFRNFNTVALITFSEPKPSEEQKEEPKENFVSMAEKRRKDYYAKSSALTDDQFCQLHNLFIGNHIDHPDQIRMIKFTGAELKSFINFCLLSKSSPFLSESQQKPSEEQVERQEVPKRELMDNLIEDHLRRFGENNVFRASTEHFMNTGKPSGSFRAALHALMEDYKRKSSPSHTDNQEGPTQEELWEVIFHELCADPGNVMPNLLPIMMSQYTITKKTPETL